MGNKRCCIQLAQLSALCMKMVIQNFIYFFHRAVANGPVDPAMAGPIIEPEKKLKKN